MTISYEIMLTYLFPFRASSEQSDDNLRDADAGCDNGRVGDELVGAELKKKQRRYECANIKR